MTLEIRRAKKSEAKPLIGLYAQSGMGKTMSALLMARGFAGPLGKVVMIETEGGRGEAYVDTLPGGYEVISIRGNFASTKFGEAITLAEKSNAAVLIIDSASHEWSGAGGVLSQAAERQEAGTKGVLVWQKPKLDHQRHFMLKLMQTPIPLVIVCMRAKYPMEQIINSKGDKEWARSKELEPDQASDILFEIFIHGWIDQGHNFHGTKYTLPELATVIQDGKPISIDTGRALAAWARGDQASPQVPPAATTPAPPAADSRLLSRAEGAGTLSLEDMAREAAMRGRDVLRTFYKAQPPEKRKKLDEIKVELEGLIPATVE